MFERMLLLITEQRTPSNLTICSKHIRPLTIFERSRNGKCISLLLVNYYN
ncbi:hypothetical protein OESDEN_21570 [Oesophagostomum dentatum]|uniref:Uncharacterized protein n=1 Tax=Oesophagostomum dentatum TaxID=61180 RepID=A0A0B1S4K2_OESDE|nr:hypothetical protein OESDEN_21570 [Oesophagostomum dentatum]